MDNPLAPVGIGEDALTMKSNGNGRVLDGGTTEPPPLVLLIMYCAVWK